MFEKVKNGHKMKFFKIHLRIICLYYQCEEWHETNDLIQLNQA